MGDVGTFVTLLAVQYLSNLQELLNREGAKDAKVVFLFFPDRNGRSGKL